MDKKRIIISIPAYNEEKTLPKVLTELKAISKELSAYDVKILVLDDGSADRTAEVARKGGAIVVSNGRNLGLAQTFQNELKECLRLGADIIVHTDADGQYPAKFIPRLIKRIESGYDLVLGSRFAGKIESMPLMKRLGNIAFAKTLSKMTGTRLTDTTTGFRAFTRDVAENIEFINTFTYTQEQIIRASKQKYRIDEIPIFARKTRDSRLFKSPFEYAFKAWINILRIYRDYDPLMFFGRIGGFFIGVGILLSIYILYLALTVTVADHLALIMLDLLLMSVGIQVLLFGFLADSRR